MLVAGKSPAMPVANQSGAASTADAAKSGAKGSAVKKPAGPGNIS